MIWVVYNGYVGNGAVCCILEAPTEALAIEHARVEFQAVAEQETRLTGRPPERYYEHLTAELITLPYMTEMG